MASEPASSRGSWLFSFQKFGWVNCKATVGSIVEAPAHHLESRYCSCKFFSVNRLRPRYLALQNPDPKWCAGYCFAKLGLASSPSKTNKKTAGRRLFDCIKICANQPLFLRSFLQVFILVLNYTPPPKPVKWPPNQPVDRQKRLVIPILLVSTIAPLKTCAKNYKTRNKTTDTANNAR